MKVLFEASLCCTALMFSFVTESCLINDFSKVPMKSEGLPRRKQLVTITVTEFVSEYINAE